MGELAEYFVLLADTFYVNEIPLSQLKSFILEAIEDPQITELII